uniref:S-adenosylmethionine synthase n=1 Tax=Euplotes crassus TaxID=5936 RepID=A0A7S3NR92_EUPCR|mmetsp:Transcript_23429/g.23387  ORF Transcript_23429/g.23387 Transcript_23429/m.23387 type:complete len:354 (+) Transcript_23429:90-1151(+)
MEAVMKGDLVVLLGEISMKDREKVDAPQIARDVIKEVGYDCQETGLDYQTCRIVTKIPMQSKEITDAIRDRKAKKEDLGAGDQGMMFGYATDESGDDSFHPLSHLFANRITHKLCELRKSGDIGWLMPDCKSQVCMKYKTEETTVEPVSVHYVIVSTQHKTGIDSKEIEATVIEKVIKPIIDDKYLTEETKFIINPSGSFVVGGPQAVSGLTGRKIISDTYGGWASHGGGCFSGKDPSKIDRTASYYARYVAKSLVASGLAKRVMVELAYAISVSDPLCVHVTSYGTVKEGYTDEDLLEVAKNNFNFRPYQMIEELKMRRPIFKKTTVFGHFGRNNPDFQWECPKKLEFPEKE